MTGIVEAIIHLIPRTGFPRVLNALYVARKVPPRPGHDGCDECCQAAESVSLIMGSSYLSPCATRAPMAAVPRVGR